MWNKIGRATRVALQAAIMKVMKLYMGVAVRIVVGRKVDEVVEAALGCLKK